MIILPKIRWWQECVQIRRGRNHSFSRISYAFHSSKRNDLQTMKKSKCKQTICNQTKLKSCKRVVVCRLTAACKGRIDFAYKTRKRRDKRHSAQWSIADSNRLPQHCQCCALPDELIPLCECKDNMKKRKRQINGEIFCRFHI